MAVAAASRASLRAGPYESQTCQAGGARAPLAADAPVEAAPAGVEVALEELSPEAAASADRVARRDLLQFLIKGVKTKAAAAPLCQHTARLQEEYGTHLQALNVEAQEAKPLRLKLKGIKQKQYKCEPKLQQAKLASEATKKGFP